MRAAPDSDSSVMHTKKAAKRGAKKEAKKNEIKASKSTLRQLKNEAFEQYYCHQLPSLKDEFSQLESCLRTPLPVTWRFSGHDEGAIALRSTMENALLPKLAEQPRPLAWYPSRLAWQFDVSRAQLRGKDWEGADAVDGAGRSDAVKALHEYIVRETDLGRVQRQEAVSMVPPLLLDVRPGMSVLDMCASPGSKSQQIIEMLAAPADIPGGGGGAATGNAPVAPRGLLIANDADLKRCHLLASRAAKLNSPSLVVTNHDARLFPETLEGGSALRFDRVLADVPCSGDGTLRKNPLIWRRWTASPGNMLHSLQLQIACKGVRLTRVGGRFVYSTCSMNPIENEAVVARVLLTFGTACLRLVDVSKDLPELKRRRGLTEWSVWHRGQFHADWNSVVERFPTKCPKLESLFPPDVSAEERAALNLERCVRLMPHDLDGSGFFVAVFEKVAEHAEGAGALPEDTKEVCVVEGGVVLPQELSTNHRDEQPQEKREARAADGAGNGGEGSGDRAVDIADADGVENAGDADTPELAKERMNECAQRMEVLHAHGGPTAAAAVNTVLTSYAPLFVPSAELVSDLVGFYGLQPTFPKDGLVVRSPTARTLLLLSDEVRALLRRDAGGALKVVNTGVRLFERQEAKGTACGYRVCADGLDYVLPAMTKQRTPCSVAAAARILGCKQLSSTELAEAEPTLAAALSASCQPGSVTLVCTPDDGLPLCVIVLYAPSGAVSPMVKGLEKQAALFRLGLSGAPPASGMPAE